MASTTQILFNSPALHSLKREQLVKLCKTHSVKATGKNAELIERLKQRAEELRPEALGNATNTHERQLIDESFRMPRPSEQWEIVMEDIAELPESGSLGTISSKGSLRTMGAGEFGTGQSKSSSVSSSIRALATSLGIKRAPSTQSSDTTISDQLPHTSAHDELTQHAVPYSKLPPPTSLPQTDHFKFSTPDASMMDAGADSDVSMSAPLPGSPSRPGAPAPANARLSMGRGASAGAGGAAGKSTTTTIRLITTQTTQNMESGPSTPVLAPFQTTFDLELGSPAPGARGGEQMSVWPASPYTGAQRLYPAIPYEDLVVPFKPDGSLPGGLPTPAGSSMSVQATPTKTPAPPRAKATPKPANADDIFSPVLQLRTERVASGLSAGAATRLALPRSEPFLFGSPLPRHSLSNKEFGDAAASVLEEMSRRLAAAGAQKVDKPIVDTKPPESATSFFGNVSSTEMGHQRTGSTDRFAKAHEDAFNKMDSIATHYAARRGAPQAAAASKKRKSDALGLGPAPGTKRKSSVSEARVISTGVRKKMGIPGGFGDEEEEEEEEDPADRRSSKRIRVGEGEDVHKGKRVSLAPPVIAEDEEVAKTREKEKQAIRRELDAKKARRRSSRGRPSVGGKAATAKSKPSRFGFLASAKSIVRNVWNMGAGSSRTAKAAVPSSSIPVPKPAPAPKHAVVETKAPVAPPSKKPSLVADNGTHRSAARVLSSSQNSKLKPPITSTQPSNSERAVSSTRASISRTRSPIPSFAATSTESSATASSRVSVALGASTAASRVHSRNNSLAGASSVGTRSSVATSSRTSAVSSMGTRRSIASTAPTSTVASRASTGTGGDTSLNGVNTSKRMSSLMAPTASSLAKAQGSMRPVGRVSALSTVSERTKLAGPRRMSAMPSATRTGLRSPRSPPPSKIFTQPLSTATFSSLNTSTSARGQSLTTAAAAIQSSPSKIPKSSVPPRPKALIARKPRISRSRVIAKLGAQREACQSSLAAANSQASRTRSSVGARKSFGGVKPGRKSTGAELIKTAAKKRARQSEYARRKSRAADGRDHAGEDSMMDVDA